MWEKDRTKETWDRIRADVLDFDMVLMLEPGVYSFQYCLSHQRCSAPENLNDGYTDATLSVRPGRGGKCVILYAGPGGGQR